MSFEKNKKDVIIKKNDTPAGPKLPKIWRPSPPISVWIRKYQRAEWLIKTNIAKNPLNPSIEEYLCTGAPIFKNFEIRYTVIKAISRMGIMKMVVIPSMTGN